MTRPTVAHGADLRTGRKPGRQGVARGGRLWGRRRASRLEEPCPAVRGAASGARDGRAAQSPVAWLREAPSLVM